MFDLDTLLIVFYIFVFSVFNFLSTAIIIKYYRPQHQQNNNVQMFNREDVDRLLETQKNEIMMKFSKEKEILSKENAVIQSKLEKNQNNCLKLKRLLSVYENEMKKVLNQPLSETDSAKLKKALNENEQLKKKTIELEETNSKLNNEIQVQVYKSNALRVRADSRLENASEQLSEIKKVANKEILALRLKLKDSQSRLALEKRQYDDMAKSSVEFFSNAPNCNINELSNHSNDSSTSNGSDKSSPICSSSSSSLNNNSWSTSDSPPLSSFDDESDNLKNRNTTLTIPFTRRFNLIYYSSVIPMKLPQLDEINYNIH
ncbi:hypothetical protein DICPUDRAFT_160066 [Dictyostelium purpureum]|uniref:Uncharacterized protein n=1 Tax=Dictyostelium purpureum TaxID=5786 RepID=F1A5M6_DICPU|nr:uncharacterized protein DICPUDRAFT_160066 [Dictyostelium purpureum]EGC28503.1 hypothetical protein DICPUDRAFT_160066 [Dictyostelium purpureum]|eukprot:XP_003294970.1 hypothetical protein DICPUDRAFT_160066 [Dictyostelium purpureum]